MQSTSILCITFHVNDHCSSNQLLQSPSSWDFYFIRKEIRKCLNFRNYFDTCSKDVEAPFLGVWLFPEALGRDNVSRFLPCRKRQCVNSSTNFLLLFFYRRWCSSFYFSPLSRRTDLLFRCTPFFLINKIDMLFKSGPFLVTSLSCCTRSLQSSLIQL